MNADSLQNSNDPGRPSQYSLAAMFYATTLLSLLFAATAPFFRAINAENRIAILAYGVIQIVCVLCFLLWYMTSRLRATLMTDKGELVHRTSFMEQGTLGFGRSVLALWTTIPAILILMAAGILISVEPKMALVFAHPFSLVLQVFAIREAVRSSLSLYYGVDKRDLEIFKSGYVHGGYQYQSWHAVRSVRPAEYDDGALMVVVEEIGAVDEMPKHTLYTKKLTVRADTRAQVCEVMLGLLGSGVRN